MLDLLVVVGIVTVRRKFLFLGVTGEIEVGCITIADGFLYSRVDKRGQWVPFYIAWTVTNPIGRVVV